MWPSWLLSCAALFAALLMAPGVGHAQGDALAFVVPGGGEIWSADLTVGNNRGLVGYTTFSERTVGAVSSTTFTWRGSTYTVTNLVSNQVRGSRDTWDVLLDVSPPLLEDPGCLTLRLGDHWLNLADGLGNGRQFFWYGLELDWRFRDEVRVALWEFTPPFEPRSMDGWGNNRREPELGTANRELLRMAGVSFAYGMTGEPLPDLPEPRIVSNMVSVQSGPMPNSAGATDMVWQWGQFLDHDISLSPEASPREPMRLAIPPGDSVFDPFRSGLRTMPFNRSAIDPATGTGADNPREQVNMITAFVDASNVYGSDEERVRALRTNDGTGKLKTSGDGRYLPYNDDDLENDQGNSLQVLFVAGDIRANEQLGLTALHTLFVREHNRLAEVIAAESPDLHGHEIFELARKIVGAQMQAITYYEFLPVLLGPGAIGRYESYNPDMDPTIANEFSTAAYRFGHTMLSPTLLLIDDEGLETGLPLRDAFFDPSLVPELGITGVLRGLALQEAQAIDVRLVDDVRNLLFGAPGGPGRDLAAMNIQRGRDHGLPDYNTVRVAYGLPPVATFADVSSDPGVQDALERAYGDLRRLDLWTGGLAEDPLPGAMLGETFHAILVDQFRRLRDGDRYWFERDPFFLANRGLLDEIRATTLADVIRRNTSIGDEIPDNVFGGPALPAVTIEPTAGSVQEGAPATFTLTRTGATTWQFTVDVLVAESGATLREGPSFIAPVTFLPGSVEAVLILPTDDDGVLEVSSTVSASLRVARTHRGETGANVAAITVHDNDGIPVELNPVWTSFEWSGPDGLLIAEAGLPEGVVAVYTWDETAQRWLEHFPGLQLVPGPHTLTSFSSGATYWVAATEAVMWTVPKPSPVAN
ncbi:MAG: hypothetical protein OXI18_05005 [bacterium]|nr:hypothetical protein [bacterium]